MRFMYVIYLLSFLFQSPQTLASSEGKIYVTEDLLPTEDELDKILAHPSLSDLMELKSYKRPSKCPIKNLDSSDLFQKLHLISTTFKNGECLKNNTQVLNALSEMAEKANLTYKSMRDPTGSFDDLSSLSNITDLSSETQVDTAVGSLQATEENLSSTGYYSNAMGYLGKISEDPDCISNLKEKGALSTMGNVLTTMGQSSLLVPSPSGFLFSAAGIGLGTTFKVLASLFKSPFDWDKQKEREQFQELNCSFYDLRREVETARVFGVNEKVSVDRINEIKKQILILEAYKMKVILKQKSVNLEVLSRKKNFYNKKNMLDEYHLTTAIKLYLDKIEPEAAKEIGNQALMVRLTTDFSKSLPDLPEAKDLKNYLILEKIFSGFNLDSVMDTHALDYKIFLRQYLRPLITYLKNNRALLDAELIPPTKEFLLITKEPGSPEPKEPKSNKEMILKIDTAYISHLKKISDTILYFQNQVKILSNHLKTKELDAYDGGSHKHFDIIEEYLKIQEFIYESYGYPYTKHFRETAYHSYKKFKKKKRKLEVYKRTIPKRKELPWVCRTAQQAIVTWDYANDSIEVLWDFLETNKDLFYQDVKKIKFFMHILPVARTKEYKLYKSARSAEIAKHVLFRTSNPEYHRDELNKYGIWTKHNLGKLMLKIKESKEEKNKIVDFMKENKCTCHLRI